MRWEPDDLGPPINTRWHEAFPTVTPDGLTLYFASDRPGGLGPSKEGASWDSASYDIYVAPVHLGPELNTEYEEQMPTLTKDGRWLCFPSDRPWGEGGLDLYAAERAGE